MEEDNNYKCLRNYLENGFNDSREDSIYLDDYQLEEIIHLAQKELDYSNNIGFKRERVKHNDREKAFQEEWLKENYPHAGINGGNGILSALIERDKEINHSLTPVERQIVATIIQWLGSNIGFSFMERALKNCGYKIIKMKPE